MKENAKFKLFYYIITISFIFTCTLLKILSYVFSDTIIERSNRDYYYYCEIMEIIIKYLSRERENR